MGASGGGCEGPSVSPRTKEFGVWVFSVCDGESRGVKKQHDKMYFERHF